MAAGKDVALILHSYAAALFNAGRRQGVVRQLVEQVRVLEELLEQRKDFQAFLEGPQISTEIKRELIDKAFKESFSPLLINLLYMMVERERSALLARILEKFQQVAEEAEGIYPATIYSARELGFQEKLRLKTALEKHTGCHLRLEYEIDPDLLGGLVFRFRDELIDGSVRKGLKEIRKRFEEEDRVTV